MAAKSCTTIPGWLKPKQNSGISTRINHRVFVSGASDFATAHPQDFCSDFPNEMAIPKLLWMGNISMPWYNHVTTWYHVQIWTWYIWSTFLHIQIQILVKILPYGTNTPFVQFCCPLSDCWIHWGTMSGSSTWLSLSSCWTPSGLTGGCS